MEFNASQPSYRALRAIISERTRRFVIWCGAGLSVPAKLPNWIALRNSLDKDLREKATTFDRAERDRLLSLASAIQKQPNIWVAFDQLHSALKDASFTQAIRSAFEKAAKATVPDAYRQIWRLGPAGLINLNIDKLATRGFADEYQGTKPITEFTGRKIGPLSHVLNSPHAFICNIHGEIEDSSSWIFTHSQLKGLIQDPAYQNFITSVLTTSTCVFIGLSMDDVAVGGHLEALSRQGIKTGPHFWITHRTTKEADVWAESIGAQIVRYDADIDHRQLGELLHDLLSYVPVDTAAGGPVVLAGVAPNSILPPEEIVKLAPEQIRLSINAEAARLLQPENEDAHAAFSSFCRKYDQAIHQAWYVSNAAVGQTFFGYEIQDHVAKGAFGRVYRALDPDGNEVAIKILLNELREEQQLLRAFRRGVRSMRILGSHSVHGMAKLVNATELPPVIIMEWIEGANLRDAVLARKLYQWSDLLPVAIQLTKILLSAHGLPERVLHRDLRPDNVMLRGFWDHAPLCVVLLDFDLSWHRGSNEKSVLHGSTTAGYLAPEQVIAKPGSSTQHASVDSFGFGMTLFFMVGGKDPQPSQHLHANWNELVFAVCRNMPSKSWRSLPHRVARLILNCTSDRQVDRWDMSQIGAELTRLYASAESPKAVTSAELIAEEIAARCGVMNGYTWRQDDLTASMTLQSGLTIEIRGNEVRELVELRIMRMRSEGDDRVKLKDALATATKTGQQVLNAAGWHSTGSKGWGTVELSGDVAIRTVVSDLNHFAASIEKAVESTKLGL